MENFLDLEGLNDCIDGTATDTTQTSKTKTKIVLFLNPSLYVHVSEAKTDKEVWDIVKDQFKNK